MFNASFFAAYRAPIDSDGFAPGENLTMVAHAAKSTAETAQAFAEQHGFDLTDLGRRETSSRFNRIDSFGVAGHIQRLFVWAAD